MHPHSPERYTLTVDSQLLQGTCRPALIWATEIDTPETSESLPGFLSALLDRVALAGESFVPAERRQRVRRMLRHGKYRPSGRGKPSSEYLLRAALAGSLKSRTCSIRRDNRSIWRIFLSCAGETTRGGCLVVIRSRTRC